MKVEIIVPSPGESISEVQIASWLIEDGDYVEVDQDVCEIDSDKATLSIPTSVAGQIKILVPEGDSVAVGSSIAIIDDSVKPVAKAEVAVDNGTQNKSSKEDNVEKVKEEKKPPIKETVAEKAQEPNNKPEKKSEQNAKLSPLAKKLLAEAGEELDDVLDFYNKIRLSKGDIDYYLKNKDGISEPVASREAHRTKMSTLRKKLSKRLVAVKNETAMLTTFNEVDMKHVMDLRKKYKQQFEEKHNVRLGYMSFFTKAVAIALKHFPNVNSMIDGDEVVHHDYCDIGIAVSAPKGLLVPVLRSAEHMDLHEIESAIKTLATKARNNKLTLDEMMGGTFTITNGGLFGSMLSTPIINPPQSAILGMHNIVDRPVAVDGKVEIRPVMYLALSYDHRVIDGKDSVGFLVKVKELLENPERLLTDGMAYGEALLKI